MKNNTRGKIIAIVTGVFSIAIGIIYLLLITVLDSRGIMLPPPPEAMGVLAVVFSSYSETKTHLNLLKKNSHAL